MDIQYTDDQKARIRAMVVCLEASRVQLPHALRLGFGLCFAVRLAKGKTQARHDALSLIRRALGPNAYLADWQRNHGYREDGSLAARTAWLDQLIRDCEAVL